MATGSNPTTSPKARGVGRRRARHFLIGGAAVWSAAILAAPLFDLSTVYAFFSAICHQDPDRTWFLAGEPLGVCIRCTSIYIGFLVGLAGGVRADSTFLKVALASTLLEFLVARAGLDFAATRALTGLMLGVAAAGFVEAGVGEMLETRFPKAFPRLAR
jgi:uncharacterized membrane protein